MPMFLGFIFGVALTILSAYAYDSSTGRAANGMSAASTNGQAPMVNWDVVSSDWNILKERVRATTDGIDRKLKQRAG